MGSVFSAIADFNNQVFQTTALPIVLALMVFLYVAPCTPFFLRTSARQQKFNAFAPKYYTAVTIINFFLLSFVLNSTKGVSFNELFFGTVQTVSFIIEKVDNIFSILMYIAAIFFVWKFKDRLLAAAGVESSAVNNLPEESQICINV